jgi:hypothetical protein
MDGASSGGDGVTAPYQRSLRAPASSDIVHANGLLSPPRPDPATLSLRRRAARSACASAADRSTPPVHVLRPRQMLRLVAEPPRLEPCAIHRPPDRPVHGARRNVAVVLRRRGLPGASGRCGPPVASLTRITRRTQARQPSRSAGAPMRRGRRPSSSRPRWESAPRFPRSPARRPPRRWRSGPACRRRPA